MTGKRETDRIFAEAVAPYTPAVRARLVELRKLILQQAESTEGVGTLLQALRWQQFSFLTIETGSGSTIRIDGRRDDPNKLAIYFHCQSGLVDHFRQLYPKTFSYEGVRAMILDVAEPLARPELEHCISLALTHHLRKKTSAKAGSKHASTPHHHRHRSRPG